MESESATINRSTIMKPHQSGIPKGHPNGMSYSEMNNQRNEPLMNCIHHLPEKKIYFWNSNNGSAMQELNSTVHWAQVSSAPQYYFLNSNVYNSFSRLIVILLFQFSVSMW